MQNYKDRIAKLQTRVAETEKKRSTLKEKRRKDKGNVFTVCIILFILLVIGLAAFIMFDAASKSDDIETLRSAACTLVIVFAVILAVIAVTIVCAVRSAKNHANLKMDADIKEYDSRLTDLREEIDELDSEWLKNDPEERQRRITTEV